MRRAALSNYERSLRWDKQKQDKAVQQVILSRAEELVEKLVEIALEDRNPAAINSLLDRAFGKARQNIGLDGGAEDKPIVFMPAQLMAKYQITPGKYKEIKANTSDKDPEAMLVEPMENVQEEVIVHLP